MIIGIGLPRTGTRSLAEALDILGYTGSHKCEVLKKSTRVSRIRDTYLIDNSLYKILPSIITNEDKFIMTIREYEDWKKSIAKFEYTGPDLLKYKSLCLEAFCQSANNLLIFDISDGWEPLCTFLERPIPSITFPIIA